MCGCAEGLVRAVVALFDAVLVNCFLSWFRRRPGPDRPASAHQDQLVPKDRQGEALPASDVSFLAGCRSPARGERAGWGQWCCRRCDGSGRSTPPSATPSTRSLSSDSAAPRMPPASSSTTSILPALLSSPLCDTNACLADIAALAAAATTILRGHMPHVSSLTTNTHL